MNNIKYSQYAIYLQKYHLQKKSIFESNTANTKKKQKKKKQIVNGIKQILHIVTSHKKIITTEKQNTVYQYLKVSLLTLKLPNTIT